MYQEPIILPAHQRRAINVLPENIRLPPPGRAVFISNVCFIQNLVSNHLTLSMYCAKTNLKYGWTVRETFRGVDIVVVGWYNVDRILDNLQSSLED